MAIMKCKLYSAIAQAIQAQINCAKATPVNHVWLDKWSARLGSIEKNLLPSGSGFDNGTRIVYERCNDVRLVFATAFHHMDENGYYDGWSEHTVIVKASLAFGISIRVVTGKDRNGIKDYIRDQFHDALTLDYEDTSTQSAQDYSVSYPGSTPAIYKVQQ
jgi:hypothetical protein